MLTIAGTEIGALTWVSEQSEKLGRSKRHGLVRMPRACPQATRLGKCRAH
jgi:hypothetical protein